MENQFDHTQVINQIVQQLENALQEKGLPITGVFPSYDQTHRVVIRRTDLSDPTTATSHTIWKTSLSLLNFKTVVYTSQKVEGRKLVSFAWLKQYREYLPIQHLDSILCKDCQTLKRKLNFHSSPTSCRYHT